MLKTAALLALLFFSAPTLDAQKFKVLAFYNGTWDGGHIGYVREALQYFPTLAAANNFSWEATNDWSKLNTSNLANYKVIIFLDDVCPAAQRAAFQTYMENGGAWMGQHCAAFNTDPNAWSWYYNTFLGMGGFKTNTWGPTTCPMTTVNPTHPVNAGIPASWTGPVNEYYGWNVDVSTKSNFKVLQSLIFTTGTAPVGSDPNQQWRSGSWPLVWTNTNYKMIYNNFGHNLVDYGNNNANLSYTHSNANYNKLILNAILWLAGETGTPTCTTFAVPGTFEAENYCTHNGIQTEITTDTNGGLNVGWIDSGKWLTYKVNVATAGSYKVEYRVSSLNGGGVIQLDNGAGSTYGTINVASTGGWQTWATITNTVTLPAGTSDLRILATSGGYNLNWIKISSVNTSIPYGSYIMLKGNNGLYVSGKNGTAAMICNISVVGSWLKFLVVDAGNGLVALQAGSNGKYVTGSSPMWATASSIDAAQKFQWISPASGQVQLKCSSNNMFVSSENGAVSMNCNRPNASGWETFTWVLSTKSAEVITEADVMNTSEGLKIFPNPSKGQFTLSLASLEQNEMINLKIANLAGQVVYSKQIRVKNNNIPIMLNNVASGMYLLSVESKGSIKTEKLYVE